MIKFLIYSNTENPSGELVLEYIKFYELLFL
jgi:hypothetical protein